MSDHQKNPRSLAEYLGIDPVGVTSNMFEHLSQSASSKQVVKELATAEASQLASYQQVEKELATTLSKFQQVIADPVASSKLLATAEASQLASSLLTCSELATTLSKLKQVLASTSKSNARQVKGGYARAAKLTTEQRREIALLGVRARRQKKAGIGFVQYDFQHD